jgi:hypothetical protein
MVTNILEEPAALGKKTNFYYEHKKGADGSSKLLLTTCEIKLS